MHADPLPIPDQPGGMLHPHDGRQAVLSGDHRAMSHQAPQLRHQALDRDEQGRPAGVRVGVTRMSPASRSASAMSRMTRARPSMVPAETGKPTSAPGGMSSRRYTPAMASPSDVSTRGGVRAWYDLNASLRSSIS